MTPTQIAAELCARHADGAAARATGLRPCKRCSPDDVSRDERAVLTAIEAIKSAGQPVRLADLAKRCGYSPAKPRRRRKWPAARAV